MRLNTEVTTLQYYNSVFSPKYTSENWLRKGYLHILFTNFMIKIILTIILFKLSTGSPLPRPFKIVE